MKSYNRRVLLVIGLLVGLTVLVNVVVDPLKVFQLIEVDGFNRVKPALGRTTWVNLRRPVQAMNVEESRVVFGSSRVETGIDKPGLFNAGVAKTSLQNMAAMVRHVLIANPQIEEVVLAVDFYAFNAYGQASTPYLDMMQQEPGFWPWLKTRAHQWVRLTLSRDLFRQSILTVRAQHQGDLAQAEPERRAVYTGLQLAFANTERFFLWNQWSPCRDGRYDYVRGTENRWEILESLVDDLKAQGKKVTLVSLPVHGRLLYALKEGGFWERFTQWKRDMVAFSESAGVSFWDFSCIDDFTTEPVPEQAGVAMEYFFDSSHMTKTLGNQVMEMVLGEAPVPAGSCGRLLASGNLDVLKEDEVRLQNYYQQVLKQDERYRATLAEGLRLRQQTGGVCN